MAYAGRWSAALVLGVVFLVGCGSPRPTDGGAETGTETGTDGSVVPDGGDDAATDAAMDIPVMTTPSIYGACTQDSDCPMGGTCLRDQDGFPRGYCTVNCTNAAQCRDPDVEGVTGECRNYSVGGTMRRICMRACENGYGCERRNYTCFPTTTRTGVCVPSCDGMSCQNMTRCNEWTSACQPASAMYPPMGRENGEPCTRAGTGSECRSSQCIVGISTAGVYSGWNNGACVSTCSLPPGYNVGSFWDPDLFPQSNCPMGSICFPNGEGIAERDYAICLDECRADSDCRVADGFYCRRTFTVSRTRTRTYMNGYCAPIDCLAAGRTCPSAYRCETRTTSSGARVGVCVPNTTVDAGTDSGTDATPTDTGPADTGPADTGATDTSTTDSSVVDVATDAPPTDGGGLDAATD